MIERKNNHRKPAGMTGGFFILRPVDVTCEGNDVFLNQLASSVALVYVVK